MICIGQVIRILSDYSVVIDVGKEAGITVGDKIQIYENTDEILNLDGEKIDDYRFIKSELEIVQCEDCYSICEAKSKIVSNISVGIAKIATSPLLSTTKTYESFQTIPSDIKPLKKGDPIVHLGDYVKLI